MAEIRTEWLLQSEDMESRAATAAREFVELSARIADDCAPAEFRTCLRPEVADKIIAGELEYLKRGRFQRIFPVEESAVKSAGHLAILKGKANAAAAWWHRRLRLRESEQRSAARPPEGAAGDTAGSATTGKQDL